MSDAIDGAAAGLSWTMPTRSTATDIVKSMTNLVRVRLHSGVKERMARFTPDGYSLILLPPTAV